MSSNQDAKNLSRERFAKFADGYVASQSHAKGYDLERLVEIAQPQPDWLGLDVATGGGHTALKFAPHMSHIIATDITPPMLLAAEKNIMQQGVKNISFKPADAEELPFDAHTFNLVTCRIAPHHFSDCAKFIQEGSRVLKTGGLLLVQDHVLPEDRAAAVYIDDFERLRDPSHHRAFSHSEWVAMYGQAGLQVTYTEEIVKRHQLIPWAERQGCSEAIVQQLSQVLAEAPSQVKTWLQTEDLGTPNASFVNHHILIAGNKTA